MRRHNGEQPIPRPEIEGTGALYRRVVDAIEAQIRRGELQVGQRLPAERQLATQLGVSRTTVTSAYQELEARGLARGHVGRGTVVVAAPIGTGSMTLEWSQRASPLTVQASQFWFGTPPAGTDVIAFDRGWPSPKLYPVEALESLLDTLPGRGTPELYGVTGPPGDPALLEALVGWLGARGIAVTPDRILVTSGAQQGLNVVARAFLAPRDVVLTEQHTFMGALLAFRRAGADVVGVATDHEGIECEALEDALVRYRPKLLYLIPTFQNPMGVVLSRERRRRVLDLAARHRIPVLESDLYGETYVDETPPASLKALDQEGLVIYQGSFSKIAVPGLRVGWLVAPAGAEFPLTLAKRLEDLQTAALTQRLAGAFLASPHLERHLAFVRAECRVRRDALVTALRKHCPRLSFRIPSGGYYLWVRLPHPVTTRELVPNANDRGVAVQPGSHFTPSGGGQDHIRLCFAGLEPRQIAEGVRRLAEALDQSWRRVAAAPGRELVSVV